MMYVAFVTLTANLLGLYTFYMLSISQPYRKEVRNQIKKRVLENRR